jgi:hypothetical protein
MVDGPKDGLPTVVGAPQSRRMLVNVSVVCSSPTRPTVPVQAEKYVPVPRASPPLDGERRFLPPVTRRLPQALQQLPDAQAPGYRPGAVRPEVVDARQLSKRMDDEVLEAGLNSRACSGRDLTASSARRPG